MPERQNERILAKNVTKRVQKSRNGRVFGKNVTERMPVAENGQETNKNVAVLSGRHWNMKKLCPGKAKFFR